MGPAGGGEDCGGAGSELCVDRDSQRVMCSGGLFIPQRHNHPHGGWRGAINKDMQ